MLLKTAQNLSLEQDPKCDLDMKEGNVVGWDMTLG